MPSNLFGSFKGPEEIEKYLNKTFLKFGSDAKAVVSPAFEWTNSGKRNLQNEYFLEVTSASNPGEKNTFFATIKMGKDNNVFLKQGSGWQLFTGDLNSVSDTKGIIGFDTSNNQQLFNQGIESFGMRIAAANYMSKQEQGTYYQKDIKSYFHEVNQGIEGTFSGITLPGFGRIAPSRVFINNQMSEEGLWRLENTLNVDIIGRAENAARQVTNQIGTKAAIFSDDMSLDQYLSGNPALIGGALDTQRGRFQKKTGFGTPYPIIDSGGTTSTAAVSGITNKIKQTYVWGGRENAPVLGVSENRIEVLDNPYVRQANMPLRPGGKLRTGLVSNVLIPRFALPWQSGTGIYNAPAPLKELLSSKGMGLAAGYASQMKIDIAGVNDVSKIAGAFNLNRGLIGQRLPTNSAITLGTYTDASGQVSDLIKSTEQQITGITGYSLNLPASMRSQVLGNNVGTITPYMVQLANAGFSNITFDNENDQATVIANTMYASTPGFKGLGFKASITPLMGVETDHDAILESKNIAATSLGIVQAMKKEGVGGLYNMLNMLYGNKYASELETFRQGGNESIEGIGQVLGFQTGELFIGDLAKKFTSSDDAIAKALSDTYNIRKVNKLVPISQFTRETMKSYKENTIAALMQTGYGKETDKVERGLSRAEAERVFKEKNVFKYDKERKLYTQYVMTEGLQADVLINFTSELSGLASGQGQYEQGMTAQGYEDVAAFMKENKRDLFRITPGKRALQEVAASYMHTISDSVDPNASYIISGRGKGGIDAATLLGHIRSAPTGTDIEKAKYIQDIINQMAGAKEGAPSRALSFEGQRIMIPSPNAAVEVDDITKEVNEAGEMTSASNAMATKQYLSFLEKLVSAEAEGIKDPTAYNKAVSFMKKFVKSDALIKDYGGIFTRPTGSSLLRADQTVLSEAAIRRNFMIMSKDPTLESWKEYRAKINKGAFGVSIRPPNTVLGSEGSPGSVMLQNILTPESFRGGQILQSYTSAGLIQPEKIISSQAMTGMGDLDYDPYMFLPLGYEKDKGGWEFYRPLIPTKKGREAFLKRMKKDVSIERQRQVFSDIYNEYALHYNPLDLAARSFFAGIGLDEKGDLYNRNVAADLTQLNKSISEQNYQKTMAMGTTFNNYIRSLEEAGVVLGVPEKQIVQTRDLASQYYQEAVDMEHVNTVFEKIMGSMSWSKTADRMNAGFFAKDNGQDWRTIWEPTSSTNMTLASGLASFLAKQPKMTTKLFSHMMTAIPELEPGQSDKERGQIIETRRKYVESQLNKLGSKFNDEKYAYESGQVIGELIKDKYIGENSPAILAMYRRLADYGANNPELHDILQKQSIDDSGKPMMSAYGKKMDYNEFAQRTRTQQILHQFNLGRKGDDSYLDVRDLAEVFYEAQEGKFAGSRIVQQLWHSYGKAAGFSNPALGNLTYAGNLPLNTREQVQEMRKSVTQKMIAKTNEYLGGSNEIMHIRASEAQRLASFEPGKDTYNTMLKKASLVGWQNPGLISIGVFGPKNQEEWESIFDADQNKAAMKTGQFVEEQWANLPAVQKGKSFLGRHADQGAGGTALLKGKDRTYETTLKPDFINIEETPEGFKVRITDTKNMGATEFKQKNITSAMQDKHGLQQSIYALLLSDRSNLTPEMRALFGKEESWDEATRNYLNPDYKKDAKIYLETNVLATKYDVGTNANLSEGMNKALKGFSKGKMSTEDAKLVNLQPMTEMTEDFRKNLKSNILAQLEIAGQKIEENLLPAAYYERGMLKKVLQDRYPGVAIGTELIREEKEALARFGKRNKDNTLSFGSVAQLSDEEIQSQIRATSAKIEGFQQFFGAGPSGGGDKGGGIPKNPFGFPTDSDDPDDSNKNKRKRPTVAQAKKEVGEHPVREEIKGSGSSFFGWKKLTPEGREFAFAFAKSQQEQYGQMVEGNFVPGPLAQEITGLQGKLSGYFANRNPEVSTQIANAGNLSEAISIAQKAGTKIKVGLQDILQDVSPMVLQAAKSSGFHKTLFGEMVTNVATLSNERQSYVNSQMPIFAGGAGRAGGNETVLAQQAALSGINDLLKASPKFGAGGGAKDEGERMVMARNYQAFEDYKKSFAEHVKTLKTAQISIEDLNKGLKSISDNAKDFRSEKASEVINKVVSAAKELANAETRISKEVTGEWKQTLTPEEKETARAWARSGLMTPKNAKDLLSADIGMQAAEEEVRNFFDPPKSKGGASLGGLARKMLGGFGLMYMGSILNLATTPMKMGYQESFEREAAFDKAFGAAGGPMSRNIEGDISYSKGLYGGVGWRSARNLYSDIVKRNQNLAEMLNVGQAGLGGAAMVGWIGSMAQMSPATLNPLMAGVGAVVAVGSMALGTYGAYKETDENALNIFSQSLLQDKSILNERGGLKMLEAGPMGAKVAATSGWGYVFNKEQQDIGAKLDSLRKYYESGGSNGEEYLRQSKGISKSESQKLVKMYMQAAGGLSEMGYSGEAYGAAGALISKYNLPLVGESPLDKFASMYTQGIDVEGVANLYVGSQYNTATQTRIQAGELLNQINSNQRPLPTTFEIATMQTGAERYSAMGAIAPHLAGSALTSYKERLGNASPLQWEAFALATQIEQMKQMRGGAYKTPDEDEYLAEKGEKKYSLSRKYIGGENFDEFFYTNRPSRFLGNEDRIIPTTKYEGVTEGKPGLTGDEGIKRTRDLQAQYYTEQLRTQTFQGFQSLGFKESPINLDQMNNMQLLYSMQMQEFAKGVGVQLQGAGVNDQKLVQELSLLKGTQGSAVKRLLSMDANQWATMLQSSPELGSMMMPTASGTQIPVSTFGMVGYDLAGKQTGLAFGATSLNSATATGLQNAERIWGAKSTWGKYGAGEGLIGAMVEGFADKSGRVYGGVTGAQLYMNEQQYNISLGQVGIQQRQIALQKAFTTGVGLDAYAGIKDPRTDQPFNFNTSGGGFWGVEDRSRQLGYRQTEYAYGMQERQMNMNDKFFWQNFSTNYQQAMQQRAWTQQDYGVQDLTRNLQWGWRQEDYQENVRFMTGRDRRLAERQMRRETIMHDIEGTQIDTQRERQQELWDLEDQRFSIQKNQHQESLDLQKEQLAKNREFYEENKKLSEESLLLQRAYWVENMKLSEESAGLSALAAKQQKEFNDTMAVYNNELEVSQGLLKLFTEETLAALIKMLRDAGKLTGGSDADSADNDWGDKIPEDIDIPYTPPVVVRPPGSGGGIPEGADTFTQYFSDLVNSTISNTNAVWGSNIINTKETENSQILLSIYLGNELLTKKVIETINSEVIID